MAQFIRQCKACYPTRGNPCPQCLGSAYIKKPIIIYGLKLTVDNRPPSNFQMIISPDGAIEFKQKGKRSAVKTTAQITFNRARMDTARDAMVASNIKRKKRL